jgi:hypothetical protein
MADWRDELVEIAECELCDDTGLRLNGLYRCNHIDYGAISKRGIAKCQEEMKKGKQ